MTSDRSGRLRVLVAIACYGEKNLEYLQRIISTYRAMDMDVHIVVLSERRKSVDLGVPQIIGLPARNPWSLPFAHMPIFAENVDRYDLFIYSEDDILVTEDHIHAFLRIQESLDPDEIAGFMRYEEGEDGTRYMPDVHGAFRWRPESVRRRGDIVTAEFTNEHAAFYVVTAEQLRRAVESGRFVCEPYEGRYDMLVSAATHIYINCGFRRVVCVSHLNQFLVHHMSNRYAGKMGIPLSVFEHQLSALLEIAKGTRPAKTLCEVEPRVPMRFGKSYDELPSDELMDMVPAGASRVLSIGGGFGEMEIRLRTRGAHVTTFPLDSVVSRGAALHGLEVIEGSLDECLKAVESRRFDCIVMVNLLHLLPDPALIVRRCARLLAPGGSLVLEGPNFEHLPTLVRRLTGVGDGRRLRTFNAGGVHAHGVGTVVDLLAPAGLSVTSLAWMDRGWPAPFSRLAQHTGRFGAKRWIMRAERSAEAAAIGA